MYNAPAPFDYEGSAVSGGDCRSLAEILREAKVRACAEAYRRHGSVRKAARHLDTTIKTVRYALRISGVQTNPARGRSTP